MERNSSGALRAFGASARHIGSSCDYLELLDAHHARLLARSGAAAFGRSTADDAASGRAGASGASSTFLSMRVCCRWSCGKPGASARSQHLWRRGLRPHPGRRLRRTRI